MAYSPVNYWRLGAVYPRTQLRQPYPMAVRTLVVPEPASGQTIVLPPRLRAVRSPAVPQPRRAYPLVTVVGGGSPPATPVLAIADNGNGTGATATITGSAIGSTNTVYVASLPAGGGGNLPFVNFSRTGDGALPMALANGSYEAYCVSTLGGLPSLPSNFPKFACTGGAAGVTPTGHEGIIQAGVAWLVASSPTFQNLVGAVSAAAALVHVPLEADDTEESGSLRPRAIVHQVQFALEKISLLDFRPRGEIWVSFEFPVSAQVAAETPRETRLRDERLEFFNRVDGILADCMNLQGTGAGQFSGTSQVTISSIELLDGPSAIEEARASGPQGEVAQYFYGATYCFHWRG